MEGFSSAFGDTSESRRKPKQAAKVFSIASNSYLRVYSIVSTCLNPRYHVSVQQADHRSQIADRNGVRLGFTGLADRFLPALARKQCIDDLHEIPCVGSGVGLWVCGWLARKGDIRSSSCIC